MSRPAALASPPHLAFLDLFMDSQIGLIIQLTGVSLITLLTLFLRRSIKVVALKHWTNAWLCMSFALFTLRLAFSYQAYSVYLFSFHFLTEFFFGLLLIGGCKSLATNTDPGTRFEVLAIPLVALAFLLPVISDDLTLVFDFHSLTMSGFFAVALVSMLRSRMRTFGWKVMLLALSLLVIDFAQPLLLYASRNYFELPPALVPYDSIVAMVLQILLGFGMVIVLLEQVLVDARVANEKLKRAHEKLKELAHIDPLTTALNRHAFHGYIRKQKDSDGAVSGCVGFFDIDDLKVVNDDHGHSAGDAVIRLVVRSIREVIRAEDLIFRWGGDEFFVLMIGIDAEAAEQRMERIQRMLTGVRVDGVSKPLTVGVSLAFENFRELTELETAIEKADAGMYRKKQIRKSATRSEAPNKQAEPQPLLTPGQF